MQVNSKFESFWNSKKRFRISYGGSGSSKSYSAYQDHITKCLSQKYYKGIMMRKNYASIEDSIFAGLVSIIQENDLDECFHITYRPLSIRCKINNNQFIFKGMKDARDREKIKSVHSPTNALMEEANEFEQADFSEVNRRLRGSDGELRQIDILFNPVDELSWLNAAFFGDEPIVNPDDIFILKSNHRDNAFLDDAYRKALEDLIREDENLFNIYVNGDWGTVDTRGRIYKNYEDKDHLVGGNLFNWTYNKNLPIIVACDFNVDPMKWALIQNVNGSDYVFDEIVLPDTTTEEMTKELLNRYGFTAYKFFGDYSGTFRHTSSPSTDYQIIKQLIPSADIKVKPNPPVVDRINAMNWRLANKDKIRRLFIHPNCKHSRNDLKKAKFKEGTREEDKSLEKYDGKNTINALIHISSAIGYYIEYNYGLKGKNTSKIGIYA